jgi:hypothetical protein
MSRISRSTVQRATQALGDLVHVELLLHAAIPR